VIKGTGAFLQLTTSPLQSCCISRQVHQPSARKTCAAWAKCRKCRCALLLGRGRWREQTRDGRTGKVFSVALSGRSASFSRTLYHAFCSVRSLQTTKTRSLAASPRSSSHSLAGMRIHTASFINYSEQYLFPVQSWKYGPISTALHQQATHPTHAVDRIMSGEWYRSCICFPRIFLYTGRACSSLDFLSCSRSAFVEPKSVRSARPYTFTPLPLTSTLLSRLAGLC
jgi:hypothetical protein